jgi:long-chain acyl-CoA synthetase
MTVELEDFTFLALTKHSFSLYSEELLASDIGKVEINYAQANVLIKEIQTKLKERGIIQGDRVAVCSENHVHWGIIYLAVTSMGAIIVPILPDFHRNELHHILKHCEAEAIFVSDKQKAKLDEEDYKSSLHSIFSIDSLQLIEELTPSANGKIKKEPVSELVIKPEDLAVIIYTSGTTGMSKGVMLTHGNLISQIMQIKPRLDIGPGDRYLSILPLAHTFECSIGFLYAFFSGAAIYYITKTPAPKIILKAMSKVKPTVILSVPLVIEKIYKNKVQPNFVKSKTIKYFYEKVSFTRKKLNIIAGKKLLESFGGNIRYFVIGGAKLSPFVESFLYEAKVPYVIGYGLTETSPLLACNQPHDTLVGSTGAFVEQVDYRIVKTNDDQADGELHVKGPNIMQGYYKDPIRTAEVLTEDGWFNTGDMAFVDKDGLLTITGRSKNVIIGASGENIYPEAIESVINQNPIVVDSLVYELDGAVVAKIYIDYDMFDELHNINNTTSEIKGDIAKELENIRVEVNGLVSNHSKLTAVFEQQAPFIKTATKKIKRYLHT